MKTIAITGGIASGKSTVSQFFEDCGATILDADQIAHQVYLPGSPTHQKIVERYGEKILKTDQSINREELAKILFNSTQEKEWLEAEIHPATALLIEEKIKEESKKSPPLILVEAALHIESGYYKRFEGLIVVDIKPEVQKRRLIERDNLNAEEVQARLKNQMPLDKKREIADWIIDNSGSQEKTKKQVIKLYKQLIR